MARIDRRRRHDPPGPRWGVDLEDLREQLEKHAERPLKIGSFSAASNVTGIVSDTYGIAELLHAHGRSASGTSRRGAVRRRHDAGGRGPALSHKDAVFISPHKFIGGPSTLGARRAPGAVRQPVPDVPGGGTVAYVNDDDHQYLDDPTHREEGGTPRSSSRSGPAWSSSSSEAVGTDTIREQEARHLRRAVAAWREEPAIELLGNPDAQRLSIVSLRRPLALGPLPAPQLRRRAAQRPLRHPVARRLLVRGAPRTPAAGHRSGALARVRARDHRGLRGDRRAGCG